MPLRIAILGIYHESNTFVKRRTTIANFKKGHWFKGESIRKEYCDAFHEIGGMMEILTQNGMEIVPVMYVAATPGGIISSETYKALLFELMNTFEKVMPVDGCLVIPHGAAVSETFADMDGHWLSILRKKVGKTIPIIGTLDPHANVSDLMIASTDALIAYKTNPHIDQRQTGKEAATLMVKFLKKKIKPFQILIQLPLAISIEQQYTENEPCKSLYALADELKEAKNVLSISILLGFPYADVNEMGTSVIIITNNDEQLALKTGNKLAYYIIKNKESFIGKRTDISVLLTSLPTCNKPVLMLDMGDNIGGGAPGDSVFLFDELESIDNCKFFICLYHPQAVRQIVDSKEKTLEINTLKNKNVNLKTVKIICITSGSFKETDPRHGGQVNYDMGKTAIVSTIKGNIIMLTSLRVQPFSLKQLTSFNINPEDFDVIVAKGVNAPIAAYKYVCPTIMQINSPGVTQADMTLFKYKNRRQPLYPFESE